VPLTQTTAADRIASPATVFIQPNTCSTSFCLRWLMA